MCPRKMPKLQKRRRAARGAEWRQKLGGGEGFCRPAPPLYLPPLYLPPPYRRPYFMTIIFFVNRRPSTISW